MAMVTLKSTPKANLSQTFPFENKNTSRDASFSAFLSGNEEAFVLKIAHQSSEQHKNKHLGTKKEEDDEIGVFGAEKYFNGVMDEETSSKSSSSTNKYSHNNEKTVTVDHVNIKVQPGTPSVRSESSWNSQSALLQSRSRNPHHTSNGHSRHRKNFFASLGCKCACTDKNSVDVGEISFKKSNGASITSPVNHKPPAGEVDLVSEALVEMNNSKKLDKLGFSFPVPKPGVNFQQEEEKVRKSLEVFGSPVFEKKNQSLRLDKRLSTMLPWDEFPANSGGVICQNESDSDASSDLFEIESLTGKANAFLARQASDACATPSCYAPSEASIEWSVVTASAADFSMMSDFEDHQRPTKMAPNSAKNAKTRMNKENPRHLSGVLLGCKSQKAVKVAGDAHRPYNHDQKNNLQPQNTRHRPESFMPATRFQAETNKLTGFDARVQGQRALAARSLPHSHSPHTSQLLFMQ